MTTIERVGTKCLIGAGFISLLQTLISPTFFFLSVKRTDDGSWALVSHLDLTVVHHRIPIAAAFCRVAAELSGNGSLQWKELCPIVKNDIRLTSLKIIRQRQASKIVLGLQLAIVSISDLPGYFID